MKQLRIALLLAFTLCSLSLSVFGQAPGHEPKQAAEPQTVTLFSRTKHQDEYKGYGKSTFSFRYGVRSDLGLERTRNNYELQYGNINWNGDSDWFTVTMVTDDCSRIKDLGELNWADISEIPLLPASLEAQNGIRGPSKTESYEHSSNGQVSKVVAGHLYVVHSKDRDEDFYTLFRVDNLVPSDKVTISWKVVPSPEK